MNLHSFIDIAKCMPTLFIDFLSQFYVKFSVLAPNREKKKERLNI